MKPTEFLDAIPSVAPARSRIRSLIVEDDDVDAQRAERILKKSGMFELQRVTSLTKAFPIIAKGNLDLILLDLNLTDCSCLDAIRSLCSLTSAKIVVLSGIDEDSDASKAVLLNGADSFISKSCELESRLIPLVLTTCWGDMPPDTDSFVS